MGSDSQPFPHIKRSGVVEDIIESVKQALIDGSLRPGQRLPSEAEMVQQLGVGRGTVREAMKMLSALGVVEIRQGDGTYVAEKPTSAMLRPLVFAILLETGTTRELFELRSLVQIGYCQLAAQNATDADLTHIEEAMKAWASHARTPNPDIETLVRLDLGVHFAILDATHNPLVVRIGRAVEEIFFASIHDILAKKRVLDGGIKGHQRVLEALHSRDQEAVRQAVVYSLTYWGEELQKKPNIHP
jgi:GntR family transcriptional repressor for pyruvate dehydrogenase complex